MFYLSWATFGSLSLYQAWLLPDESMVNVLGGLVVRGPHDCLVLLFIHVHNFDNVALDIEVVGV